MTNEYEFLKKQRYEYYKGTTEIMDNEANELVEDVVDVLNQKDYNIIELLKIKQFQAERIAELEEQLKNATHKFSIGKEVYYLGYKYKFEPYVSKYLTVCKGKILDIILREEGYVEYNFTFDDFKWITEENCFETKAEAEVKLRELNGEKK